MEGQPLVVVLERANHQSRAKTTASDPNPQDFRKRNSARGLDLTLNNSTAKSLDVIDFTRDVASKVIGRSQLGIPQPVVPDLPLFIGIRNGTRLKLMHGSEGTIHGWLQRLKLRSIEVHSADIQPQPKIVVIPEEITKPLPLNLSVASAEIRKAHGGVAADIC
jgi:hypothetical protein